MILHTLRLTSVFFAITYSAFAGDYTIPSFETGARTIPPSGNDIIVPFEGTALKQVSSVPELKPGEVLLRRRFSAMEYGLFIGRINENAYPRLSAFRLSQNNGLGSFVAQKYYTQESKNPDLDIANIYFDHDLVYVENSARIFYNDNTWRNISAETKLPARLTITSAPSGAQVLIDGQEKGTTPYSAGAVFSPSAVVQVKKDGYYILEDFVDLEGKSQVTKSFTLSKKLAFSNGAEIDAEAYSAENTESVDELELRLSDLSKKIETQKDKNKKALDDFESKYPPLQPQGEFEKTESFKIREENYKTRKIDEKNSLNNSGNNKIANLNNIIDKIKNYKTTIENRIYQRYFSTAMLSLEKYIPDKECFPVVISIREGEFDVVFRGNLSIPIAIAPDFKQRLSEGRISLSYRNVVIKINANGTIVKRFYDFTSIKLRFLDKDYDLTGNFELSEELRAKIIIKNIKDPGFVKQLIGQIKQDGKSSISLADLKKYASFNPTDAEAQEILANIFFEQKDYNGAQAAYAAALKADPKNPEVAYKAASLLEKFNVISARKSYEANIIAFPNDYRNYLRLGLICAKDKTTLAQSVSLLEKASSLADTIPTMWLVLGQVYDKLGNEKEELEAYKKLVSMDPQNYEANKRIGIVLMNNNVPTDAIVYLEMANTLSPKDTDVLNALVKGYIKTNRNNDAITALEKARALRSDDAEVLMELVDLYNKTGQDSKALDYLRQLVEIKKGDNKLMVMYAKGLAGNGKYNEAEDVIKNIRANEPQNIEALMIQGDIQRSQKKLDDAIETFKEISYINPNYAPALYERAEVHLLQGKYQWAKTFYERALRADPNYALAELGLAKVAKSLKNIQGYKEHIEKAYSMDHSNPEIAKEWKASGGE